MAGFLLILGCKLIYNVCKLKLKQLLYIIYWHERNLDRRRSNQTGPMINQCMLSPEGYQWTIQ